MDILYSISLITMVFIGFRSVTNLIKLGSNLSWLKKENTNFNNSKNKTERNVPKFLIFLPMLREQRVIKETLNYFSNLDYPKDSYKIIVITTEKENFQKLSNQHRLYDLANDLSLNRPLTIIKEKHLGLFSSDWLELLHAKYSDIDVAEVAEKLKTDYQNYPTTLDIAKEYSQIINLKFDTDLIKIIHYPETTGLIAHQINYTTQKLSESDEFSGYYCAIYNADSRPNPNSLKYVADQMQKFKEINGFEANIVQQSSIFTLNYNTFPKNIIGYFLRTSALLQTKWTLIHELDRFRTQSSFVLRPIKNIFDTIRYSKISHCVMHGLFLKLSFLRKNKIPTDVVSEDLLYGFEQCCKGEPILPIPLLENSESPETFTQLHNQKRFWFWAYIDYWKYRNRVISNGLFRSKMEVNILTLKAYFDGLIWICTSILIGFPLFYSLLTRNITIFIFWCLVYCIYWIIPTLIIYTKLPELETYSSKMITKISFADFLLVTLFGIPVLLSHSLGPIQCTFDFISNCFTKKLIVKNKTER